MNQQPDARVALCHHETLDHDIHLFTLQDNTRAAVDDLIEQLDAVVLAAPRDTMFRYIVDMRASGSPSFPYFRKAGQAWVQRRSDLLPPVRTVFLSQPGPVAALGDSFAGLLRRVTGVNWHWRFMVEGDIAAAVAWLRDQ